MIFFEERDKSIKNFHFGERKKIGEFSSCLLYWKEQVGPSMTFSTGLLNLSV